MATRISVPDGEHPIPYASNSAGSPRLMESREESYSAMFFNDSGITPRERDLIRIRVVYETDCNLCGDFRPARDIPGYSAEDIPEELYEHACDHAAWAGYTDRERLVIEFIERYMFDYQSMCRDDEFWVGMKAKFSDVEIADLCVLAGHWEGTRRQIHLLLGIDDICAIPVGEVSTADRVSALLSR